MSDKRIILLCVALTLSSVALACKAGITRSDLLRIEAYEGAEIYYIHWYSTYPSSNPRVEDVRKAIQEVRDGYSTKMSIRSGHEIFGLLNWLDLGCLIPIENDFGDDDIYPNLVIDIRYKDGKVETYFSDGQYLYDEELTEYKEVNVEFRKKFSFDALVLEE